MDTLTRRSQTINQPLPQTGSSCPTLKEPQLEAPKDPTTSNLQHHLPVTKAKLTRSQKPTNLPPP